MTVTITLEDDLASRVAREAEGQQLSIQEWATRILEQAVDRRRRAAEWQDLNTRRLALIAKEYSVGLADSESEELAALQDVAARVSEPEDRRLLDQLRQQEEKVGHECGRTDE